MGLIPFIAVGLVLATVAASLVIGQRLGEVRKVAFQLEMQAEELRRQVMDIEEDSQRSALHVRALTRLRSQKQETLGDLYEELKLLQAEDVKEITVASGLRQHNFALAEVAA